MDNLEALQILKEHLTAGNAILTAGNLHDNIPTIHNISHRDGASLKVDSEVLHAGFGCFYAKVGGRDITFDGGGAMTRIADISYTLLQATPEQLESMGYDIEEVLASVEELISEELD